MKYILVAILTPIYIIIKALNKVIELAREIGEPFAIGINEIIDNMYNFWKNIFKW